MNTREQLEYAAKAMGILEEIEWFDHENCFAYGNYAWRPNTDQADSDRMACKLRMSTVFDDDNNVCCTNGRIGADRPHNNTDEDVCRAVREARLAVAVEIGRMK